MNRRFRQVFTALREHGCVSYAKIATVGGICNVDLMIVKATTPDDLPLPEKYVHQLLNILSVSPTCCRAVSLSFSRRFGKTRSWRVALKCLLLLHRLLRSLPEDSPFRSEMVWNRTNGLISLNPCRFQDASSSTPECYTTFIRSYASLLDEALRHFSLDGTNKAIYDNDSEQSGSTLAEEREEIATMLEVLPQLQTLIDRVMDCRPTGAAAKSFLIQSSMKYIIRDSFNCYTIFRKDIVLVLDNLFQMPYRSSIAAFGIYKKAALQANQLWEFYEWCRLMGFCGIYEYPLVDRIPRLQIQALETFIDGMWQLTSSPSSSPSSPSPSSPSSLVRETFDGEEEREPLIKIDEGDQNGCWEELLDASVNDFSVVEGFNNGNGSEKDGWQIQVYNPNISNPYYYHQICCAQYASSDPKYPWGL